MRDVGGTDPRCPGELPLPGSDCASSYGLSCSYPIRNFCRCDESPGTWRCLGPRAPGFPDAPSSPDPAIPIAELSEEDCARWCQWFADAHGSVGGSTPEDVMVDSNGWTIGGSCRVGDQLACNVMVPVLSAQQCAQNLALSTCGAPISELTDCIETSFNGCVPSPHGCARYAAAAGCSGTIVVNAGIISGFGGTSMTGASGYDPFSCSIQVE